MAPISQVEAAAPVKFKAPAEVSAKVPDEVVDMVSGPLALVSVSPSDPGPEIVAAEVPLNDSLPESVMPTAVTAPVELTWKLPLVPPTDNNAAGFPEKVPMPMPLSKVSACNRLVPLLFRIWKAVSELELDSKVVGL